MRILYKLSFIIAGIFLGFVLLEIFLRVYYWIGGNRLFGIIPQRTTLQWHDGPIVGKRLFSNQSGWFVSPNREYLTWINVNSTGWRDSGHSLNKPTDTYRILIIGDSFVENFQVPLEKTFFKQLERNLYGKIKDKKVEVIAMGLGDSGTAQQYLILKEYGLTYKPDLVLHLFFTGNDIKNNSLALQNDIHKPYFKLENGNLQLKPLYPIDSTSRRRVLLFVKNNIRILELLLDIKGKLLDKLSPIKDYPVEYHVYDKKYTSEYEDAWNVTQALILESKKITEEIGAYYILVSLANNEQVNDGVWEGLKKQYSALGNAELDLEKPDKILYEFCQEEEINCHFMLPHFKEFLLHNPQFTTHYTLDGHWTETGTTLAAEILLDEVKKILHDTQNEQN